MIVKAVVWFLPEIGNAVKMIAGCLFGLLFMAAITIGTNVQPWSQWWIADRDVLSVPITKLTEHETSGTDFFFSSLGNSVTDAARFQLARAAGFGDEQAVVITAISMAENGSGNPNALSSTRDIGLWQINEVWWSRFGGQEALTDPLKNAQAAKVVYDAQGLCAWYTYDVSCGPRHTSAYKLFLERARLASAVQQPHGPMPDEMPSLMRAIGPWMGIKYLFGGTTKSGVDCSAFTQDVMRQLGVNLPRTAEEQYRNTRRVSLPQVGDLVFFERTYVGPPITHVGIYLGDNVMVSAIEPVVGRQSLNDPYWLQRLVGYGRIALPVPSNQA